MPTRRLSFTLVISILLSLIILSACIPAASPSPTSIPPTLSPTASYTPLPTFTPTETPVPPTATPIVTATPTPEPTNTPKPTLGPPTGMDLFISERQDIFGTLSDDFKSEIKMYGILPITIWEHPDLVGQKATAIHLHPDLMERFGESLLTALFLLDREQGEKMSALLNVISLRDGYKIPYANNNVQNNILKSELIKNPSIPISFIGEDGKIISGEVTGVDIIFVSKAMGKKLYEYSKKSSNSDITSWIIDDLRYEYRSDNNCFIVGFSNSGTLLLLVDNRLITPNAKIRQVLELLPPKSSSKDIAIGMLNQLSTLVLILTTHFKTHDGYHPVIVTIETICGSDDYNRNLDYLESEYIMRLCTPKLEASVVK